MAVTVAGFSERVFEFGFNAEFAQQAVLAAAPHIPTQNQEKALGYDVKFAISARGGALRYIALQHKVSRFVSGGTGLAKYRAAVGPDYYAFRLDVDQFNLIESVASSAPPGLDFYYCAPIFTSLAAINSHYLANSILSNSLWLDVRGLGPLTTSEPHSIVYGPKATKAFVFSEAKPVDLVHPATRQRRTKPAPNVEDPRQLYALLFEAAQAYWSLGVTRRETRPRGDAALPLPVQPPRHRDISDPANAINAIGELLSEYFGCSFFVEVPN